MAMFDRDFSAEKSLVREFHQALFAEPLASTKEVLSRYTSPQWKWRGMHPFNEKTGCDAVAEEFWVPLKQAFSRIQRRPDIFMAGCNEIDGFESVWVVSMGHLMGLFDNPWLGIRPTGRIVMMRYVEFNRVENGKITESAMFFDIPQVMIQAGQNPFPPQTGAHLIQPGPLTHEGLMWSRQNPEISQNTLNTINAMLTGMGKNKRTSKERLTYADELAESWHDDMLWWGPHGIGATYSIERYIKQHARPFGQSLNDGYRFNGHICRLAEGRFGGFFGWANLTVRNSGGYMGMPAGLTGADMRVVDIYREHEGKLAENWVFIDLLHFLNMQGLDVLQRNIEVNAI
ncbi:nuclear transport factor 2 family protein [Alteromonas oceanisediminis]|uniref:nuclear transport factor 2 family protein n=1 Tax=Alteromonas oceanisediminis TaxID=2836180 RepID=UPI001BD92CC0|nr:nuclear transport factor 2 family protein [Alteromonas oceanisediminis]MBT0585584.1 nuclear transport factor 2 family protein [Alteromonas oceanisediminis]